MHLNEEIVELIYDVALGESSWEEVVQALKIEFGSYMVNMIVMNPKQAPVVVSTVSNQEFVLQAYGEYYHSIDPWNFVLTSGKLPLNTIQNGQFYEQCMKDEDFQHTEYFTDFWKPNSLYHTAGGLLKTRNNISIVMGFPREREAGPYETHETLMMTSYSKHLVRAIELDGFFGMALPKKVYAQALGASFGLSVAESRLVLELFKCGSLPKACKSLNRSYHTVRNQMKSIFKKTETSNQIELFKFLVASPA